MERILVPFVWRFFLLFVAGYNSPPHENLGRYRLGTRREGARMGRGSRRTAVVALSCVVLAACNGGGGDRLTEEEFVEQANQICSEGNDRLDALAEELFADLGPGDAPSGEDLEEYFDTIVDDVQGQLDDIGDLNPPEELEDDVDALLSEAQSSLDDFKEQGSEALLSDDDPFAESNQMADDIGLTECGGSG
jgi:hypothetical protein